MKKILSLLFVLTTGTAIFAQNKDVATDSVVKVTVNKDARLDLLAKAQVDIAKMSSRFVKGYRLFVLKTNNRDYAMKVRTYLLQNFPDEKVIMTYQSPFYKMKFGDFEDKPDAERIKKQIESGGVVTGGVYIVPDTIELKPDRIGKEEQ